jgi:CRISPR-associated protein Cas2
MFLVVTYDIPDDRRRTRLHRDLKGFGMRVQYSVFECVLDEPEVARLQAMVRRTIKRGEDHVRYYRLCENCVSRITALGGAVTQAPRTHVV